MPFGRVEGKGGSQPALCRCALLVTQGFRDLLAIGNQSRPRIFDLEIWTPDLLYETVVEVDEEVRTVVLLEAGSSDARLNNGPAVQVVIPLGDAPGQRAGRSPKSDQEAFPPGGPVVPGTTGELVCVRRAPDLDALRRQLAPLLEAGIRSIAVVLKHSAVYPRHEQLVGELARSMGFTQASLSVGCSRHWGPELDAVSRRTGLAFVRGDVDGQDGPAWVHGHGGQLPYSAHHELHRKLQSRVRPGPRARPRLVHDVRWRPDDGGQVQRPQGHPLRTGGRLRGLLGHNPLGGHARQVSRGQDPASAGSHPEWSPRVAQIAI